MLAMSVSISAEPALSASEIRHQPDRKNTLHFAPLNPSYLLPQASHQREERCRPQCEVRAGSEIVRLSG